MGVFMDSIYDQSTPRSNSSFSQPQTNDAGFSDPRMNSFFAKYSAMNGGTSAQPNEYENRLRSLMDNPNSIADSGAYKFAFNQGQQALERSAAAKGMTGSGNVLAELAKYGQGMASQQYNTEANRLAEMSNAQNQFQLGRESNAIRDKATMFDIYNKTPRFVIA